MSAGSAALPDGRGGPHAVVDDIDAPTLEADDRHHLERVLRLRVGDLLTVTDGRGAWRPAHLGGDGVEPAGDPVRVRRPDPQLTVAFALAKGAKPELAVQKLTELGIDRMVIFEAGRSVARWSDERLPKVQVRLARIAREALMQSRGVWLPIIEVGWDFDRAVAELPRAALAERGGRTLAPGDTSLLIGPEGGWTELERSAVPDTVTLGDTVLRAETAAIAAGVLLAARRAGALS